MPYKAGTKDERKRRKRRKEVSLTACFSPLPSSFFALGEAEKTFPESNFEREEGNGRGQGGTFEKEEKPENIWRAGASTAMVHAEEEVCPIGMDGLGDAERTKESIKENCKCSKINFEKAVELQNYIFHTTVLCTCGDSLGGGDEKEHCDKGKREMRMGEKEKEEEEEETKEGSFEFHICDISLSTPPSLFPKTKSEGSYLHFPLSLLPHSTVPLWLPPTKAALIANLLLLLLCHKFVRKKQRNERRFRERYVGKDREGQFSPLPLRKRKRGAGQKSAFKSTREEAADKLVLDSPGR